MVDDIHVGQAPVAAARRIGVDPASILFIDDNERNVAGARIAGLAAEQWDKTRGHDTLLTLLARHDVIPGLSA